MALGAPGAPAPNPSVSAPGAAAIQGYATHYGPSYNGSPLGCAGYGVYRSGDPTIVAVGPARYREWPCGTLLRLCGPAGCAVVVRKDSCPGCGPYLLDLSEAANTAVCGSTPHTCRVSIEVLP